MTLLGNWQDYRGRGDGVLIHLATSRFHELPVREAPGEGAEPALEPNYETGSFGLAQCLEARTRAAAMKARRRYLLFGTRYQGLREDRRGRFLIIGAMRLEQVMEVRKRHVHRWMEKKSGAPPECLNLEDCYAFGSREMNFYSLDDAFELTEALMKKWGYKGKITKQMKLTFSEERLAQILGHFQGKTPCNAEYQAALKEAEERAAQQTATVSTTNAEAW